MSDRSEWREISTAPRDGTCVLAFGDGMMAVMEWGSFHDPRLNYWRAVGASGYECETYLENPTHWMPLPQPPEAEK